MIWLKGHGPRFADTEVVKTPGTSSSPVPSGTATIGVSDHAGWAVLVTVAANGQLLDRRRVDLVDRELPKMPHHVEAQKLPLEEASALVEQVRNSASRHAHLCLEAVAQAVPLSIVGIALRQCPALPLTLAERINDYRARNVSDWVMYREALAAASRERGWTVSWYDARSVLRQAEAMLDVADPSGHFQRLRRSLGPPWSKDHQLAMAAARVAHQMITAPG